MEEQRNILKPIVSRMDVFEDMFQKGQLKTQIPINLQKILDEADYDSLDDNELVEIRDRINEILEFRKMYFDHKDKFIERLNKEKQKLREQMFLELNEEKKKMINEIRSKIANKIIETKNAKKQVAFESEEESNDYSEEEIKPKPKRKPVAKKK